MSFQLRLMLAAALSLIVLYVNQLIFPPPDPVVDESTQKANDGDRQDVANEDGTPAGSGGTATDSAVAPVVAATAHPAKPHRIGNELLAVEVENDPAGLIGGVELLDPQFRDANEAGKGLDFLALAAGHRTLKLAADAAGSDVRIPKLRGEVIEASESSFVVRRSNSQLVTTETLRVADGYELSYEVEFRNQSQESIDLRPQWTLRKGGAKEASRYKIDRALCMDPEGVEDADHSDVDDGPEKFKGPLQWVAVDSKYFVSALVPDTSLARCEIAAASGEGDVERPGLVNTAFGDTLSIDPGATRTVRFGMYIGPKINERLREFSQVENAGLEDAIDWGFLGGMSKWLGGQMLGLLRFFHQLTGIWGVAIILLTVVVKLLTLPLTLRQYNSMRKMREVQPEMQELKEKYKDDKVKQQREMQALFARRGVNPLLGCLPAIVQLPVWFALYSMLQAAVELYREPFLWLTDMTEPDAYFILPVAMAGLMWLQMHIQPSAGDPQQQAVMKWAMPGFFLVMMLLLPSGLGVYMFANILLSLVQSYIQLRPSKPSPEPAT